MKTSWRRISSSFSEDLLRQLQDALIKNEYIHFGHTSPEEVFKTSSRCIIRFKLILLTHLQDVLKTSLRPLAKMSSRHLQDVVKKSLRRLPDVSSSLNCSCYHFFNTYWGSFQHLFNTFPRRTVKIICLGHTSKKFMVKVKILQD